MAKDQKSTEELSGIAKQSIEQAQGAVEHRRAAHCGRDSPPHVCALATSRIVSYIATSQPMNT
jgi:hypothetical protein